MKTALKITATLLLLAYGIFKFILAIAVAGSSHNISMTDREKEVNNFQLTILIVPLLILAVWIPWTRLIKRK